MDSTQFLLVFLMDLLLSTTSQVAPPTNVTFHCHNLQNFLKWDYGQIPPGLKFKVTIGSESDLGRCSNHLLVEKPPLQADVSFLSDPDESFLLHVRAVTQFNESDVSPPDGITFSYFHGSLVNQKCSVDLPPVNVTSLPDNHVTFRFEHPWLLYHKKLSTCKKRNKKGSHQKLTPFTYHVTVADQKHTNICEEKVCEKTLFVGAAQEKPCLHISGEFLKMLVEPKQEYCAQPINTLPDHTAIYVVLGIIILMAVAGIIFMVYRKKTRSSSSLPNSIKPFAPVEAQVTIPKSPDLDTINTPDSPTPLLTSIEETDVQQEPFIHVVNGSTEYDLRIPLGMSPNNVPDNVTEGTANGDGSAYKQGNNLEEEEEEEEPENSRSPYETRPVPVQLAPDDRTEGYRG